MVLQRGRQLSKEETNGGKVIMDKKSKELVARKLVKIAQDLVSYSSNLKKGDKLNHSRQNSLSIELVEPTSKGWKVKETETFANKRMKPKTKTKFYNTQDLEGARALFRKGAGKKAATGLDDIVSRISRMTQRNDHTGAMLYLVSKVLRHPTLTKKMKEIEAESRRLGHTPHDLINERDYLQKLAFNIVKKRFGQDGYEEIHGAF